MTSATGHPVHELLGGGGFFGPPRWHEGAWWVSDVYRQVVLRVQPSGQVETVLEVPGRPAGLGWLSDGSLLVVSMQDRQVLRGDGSVYSDLSGVADGDLYDMVVDDFGRGWVTSFGFDVAGGGDPRLSTVIQVHTDGHPSVAGDRLALPTAAVVTEERFLLVTETLGSRVAAFTIATDGTLEDRRIWAQLAPDPGVGGYAEMLDALEIAPYGCALDAEGHLWVADGAKRRAIRLASNANIVDEVTVPDGLGVYGCMLGGEDGRTLALCAAPDFLSSEGLSTRDATLYTTEVTVPHSGMP